MWRVWDATLVGPSFQVAKEELDPEALPLVFTRGRVDVSPLKELLSRRGPTIWTDEVRSCRQGTSYGGSKPFRNPVAEHPHE